MRSLFVTVLLSVVAPAVNAADEKPVGNIWYGVMDAGVREFRFRIEPVPDTDAATAQQLVSLDEGGRVFPLDDFRQDDSQLQFRLNISKAEYSGTISDDGNVVTGKWRQRGKDLDLVFRKLDAVHTDRPSEVWSGVMTALFQKLTMRIRVYKQDDGSEIVYLDSVTQKAGGFKAKRTVEGIEWTIAVDSLGGSFKGTINKEKSEVKGKWTQGGVALDLTLSPDTSEEDEIVKAPSRPQTPKPPFPYLVEDVTFTNETDGVRLAGTMTVPKSATPCPAAILISGSGPQDRDESLLGHKPFWIIADHLSRHGIAVLRFDDRGTGASTGDFQSATSEDFSRDVEAAFEHLRRDPRVEKNATGLIGHSEGGILAPMVAGRRSDVAFVILLAGTGVNGREILLSQGQLILKAQGVTDEAALKAQRDTQVALIDTVINAPVDATQDELVASAMLILADVLPAEALEEETLKPTVSAGIERVKSQWFRFFLTHEPGPVLEKVKCPVLALNGEKDVQVDPQLNLPAIREALRKGGNTQFETVELPSLNHLFQTCRLGAVSEYQTIEETVSPIALEKITNWIHQNALALPAK
ncbi:MAG TPA: alpha/beta hydrolase [Planctomycetes bacterium]|nr:alpha/beta hydrolase [Planctomycetota bacterium]